MVCSRHTHNVQV